MSNRGRKPKKPLKLNWSGLIVEGKRCSKCRIAKPYQFFDRLWRSADGRYSLCKVCKGEENSKRSRAKY